MQSKKRIAILVALMFAMPAAVIAVEHAGVEYSAELEAVESQAAETEAPAEAAPAAQADAAPAEAQPEAVVEAAPVPAPAVAVAPVITDDAFPRSSNSEWVLLPSQIAYFEQLEQRRGRLIASGDDFPKSTNSEWQMLPSQIAYFERVEQQRLASAQPAPQEPATPALAAEARTPLQTAVNYVTGFFRPGAQ